MSHTEQLGLTPLMLSPLAWRAIIDCIRDPVHLEHIEILAASANELERQLNAAEKLFLEAPGGLWFDVIAKKKITGGLLPS